MNCYYCGNDFSAGEASYPHVSPLIPTKDTCPNCLSAATSLLNNRRTEFEWKCAEAERIQKLNAVTVALNGEQIQELRRILGDFIVDLAPTKSFVSSGMGNKEFCVACKASATTGSYRSFTDPDHKPEVLTHQTDCTYQAAERWFSDLRTRLEEMSGAKVAPDVKSIFKIPTPTPVEVMNLTPEQTREFYKDFRGKQ